MENLQITPTEHSPLTTELIIHALLINYENGFGFFVTCYYVLKNGCKK